MTTNKSVKGKAKTNNTTIMESLLGPTLLTSVGNEKPTKEVMAGKDIVVLYFSASWCPPCKAFTPKLTSFYNACCKSNKVEIVFLSSDNDNPSFETYFHKMPWTAIPYKDQNSRQIISNVASQFKIQYLPSLIVLDIKTGFFITNKVRDDVITVMSSEMDVDVNKGNDLIKRWKEMEAVPIEDAQLVDRVSYLSRILSFILRNPMYMIGMYYLIKQGLKKLAELSGGKNTQEEAEL